MSATEALEGASELDVVTLRAAVSDADGAARQNEKDEADERQPETCKNGILC